MELECKIMLLGDTKSGKTSIMKMSYDSTFDEIQQVFKISI